MADYRVDIDVNVDDSKLDALEKRINNLKNKDVEVDVKASDSSVKNLNSVLKGKTKNQTVVMKADSSNIQKTMVAVNTALKNASKAGKIKLDFDDNGAVKGINKIQELTSNGKTIAFRIEGVDAAGNAFTAIQSAIGKIEDNPVDIKFNYKSLEQTKTEFQQVQADYKELIKTSKEIGSIKVKLAGLDEASADAKALNTELTRLEKHENDIASRSFNKFSKEQIDGINALDSKNAFNLARAQGKLIDKNAAQEAKGIIGQIESEYKDLINVIQNIGNTKLQLVGLDEASAEAKELTAELTRLEAKKNEISSRVSGWLTEGQKSGIKEIEAANERSLSRKQAQLVDKSNISSTNTAYKELISTMKEIGSVRVQLRGLDEGSMQAEKLTADLERLKSNARNIFDSNTFNASQMNGITSMTEKIDSDLDNVKNKIADARAEAAKGIELKVNNGGMTKDFAKVSDEIHKLGSYSKEVEVEYNDLIAKQKELSAAIKNGDVDKVISANEKYVNSLDKLENKLKTVSIMKKRADEEEKLSIAQAKTRQDANTLSLSIDAWLRNNSAAEKEFGSALRSLQIQLKSCDAVQLTNLKSQFDQIKLAAEQAGKTGLNFKDRLQMQFTRLAGYFGASSVIMGGIQAAREMFQNVLDVDTQLTELYRVTDLTSEQYSNLYDTLTGSAQQYGAVLSDLISATADWSRAGFSPEDSAGLAEVTSIYQHISDLDYDEASENLLTAYKGFQKQLDEDYAGNIVEEVSYVSDILNELDNNYSVTAAGVGEALKRSASAMSVAGNTIQETAGMVTGITEVTQDPEKAGNALKVVSMRLRGMKGELEDLGEDVDDNVTNLSKMQGQILEMTHGKVNIFDDSGEFKSTYEILQGIANVWDELSSTDQAELLETVAGKHRANDVAAIFQNWEHVEAATKSATKATGSAARENEKYANSIQGHLDKLTSKWQEFSNSAADSDFLKGIIQFGTDALGALDSIIDKFGVIKPLAVAAGAAFTLAGKGMFKTVVDDAGKAHIEIAGKAKETASSVRNAFSGIGQIFGELFNSFNAKLGGGKVFNFDKTLISNMGFIPSLDNDINSLKRFQAALESAQAEGKKFNANSAIYSTMNTASNEAKRFAQTWDGSKESLADFTEECLRNQGVISGSAKSFSNVRSIINHYNGIIDESGKKQREFANIISAANPQFGNYLTGLNGASASLGKYVVQLGIAAVKTVALQAASMALNAALTLGISVAITAAVEAISHWINAADELSDKVDDVVLKYQQQKETLNENKKTIDSLSESYGQLSKGVNTLTNENVSLSTDEYSEYCDIVNQIAGIFPELISGYDAQGNAVLTCAGSVEKLNEAYKEAANTNFDEILNNDTDIFKDFKNKSKDIEPGELWGDSFLWDNNSMRKDSYEALKKVLDANNGSDLDQKINKYITSNIDTVDEISKALEDKGIKRELFQNSFDHVRNALKENPKIAKEIVSDFEKQMASSVEDMQATAEAYIGKAFLNTDYSHISDNMQQMISSIVPNLGYDYFSQFDEVQDLYNSLDDMLSSINSLGDGDKKTFETYFDLQSKVNNGECTVGEYISNLNDVSHVVDGLDIDEESKKALKLSLKLEDNDIKKQYDNFVGQLVDAGKSKSAAKKLASSLTSTELKAAVKLEAEGKIDLKKSSLKDIKEQIQNEAKYLEAMKFTIDIDAETDSLDKFNSAMSEARSGTGLTLESFDALKSRYKGLDEYNPAKLFQETANGISLNAEAVSEYESALAKNKLDETNENISTLKDKYYDLTGQIQNCSDATQKASLINEQEDIRQKINDLAELATMYEGLTSSYNEWQNAEASGNDRDMYENVFSARENIQKELDNGWIDDGTKEYFQLIWGEDKWTGAGKSVQDYRNQWAKLDETISGTSYSINDFFKTNEDGELTSEGIFNFFDAVGEKQEELGKDWIQYDEDGNIKSFNFGVDGDKAIADAMGISEELVQIFLRASQDCGFVVNFDGTYTQLADMQDQATAAAAKLKELGKTNVDFDFNTTDISSLNSQLEEAHKILADPSFWNQDGTFNFEVDGATEAMQVVSTLQATIDSLDNHYIGLTVEDDKFEEPLQKLQDYENKVATLNQLKLNPKANAEDIEKLEADIQDIVQYVRDHADDLKLDIDAETSDEDIQNMIESGEIEIPTTLDIQTNMSETLDDLKDIALLTSGFLTEDQELELKVKLGIATDDEQIKSEAKKAAKDAEDIINSTEKSGFKFSDSGKKRATKFLENNKYVREYDKPAQDNVVKFVADWSDIDEGKDKYSDEQIESVVKFVKDVNDIDDYIANPIKKQAIVDFVVENEDVINELNLNGDEKSIVVDFVASNPDFLDGLNDGQKKVAIDFVAKNPDFFDNLDLDSGEKKVVIDFIAKNGDILSNIEDEEQKKVVVDFIVKNPDIFDNLNLDDNEKKIAVDFIAKNSDVLNDLEDDDKQVLIEYIAKNPDALDGLEGEDKQIKIDAIVSGKEGIEQINNDISGLSDKQIQVIAQTLGRIDVDNLKSAVSNLEDKQVQAIATAMGQGDVNGLKSAIDGMSDKQVQAVAQALGFSDVESLKSTVAGLDGKQVQAIAQALGITDVNSLRGAVNGLDGKTVKAIAEAVGGENVTSLQSTINSLTGKTVNVVANLIGEGVKFLTGGGGVDGTAHVNGTAFANGTTGKAFSQGDWGTKKDGVALGGELGTELLVRDGRWYTIGEDSAEFFGYKKGDIIFNADQTREIFEKGKITHGNGRGKALASGTAFSRGSGASNPWKSSGSSSSASSYNSSSSGSSSSSSSSSSDSSSGSDSSAGEEAEKFEETLDWIETAIDRIERAISRLDKTASSTYKKWHKRNSALNDKISKTREEIDMQQRAYDRYIQQANSVGLDEGYASKVRNGTIDIEVITDEDLNDKISQYKEW